MEYTEVDVEILSETELAFLVSDGDITTWVPKSQVVNSKHNLRVGGLVTVEIPEWLAIKKGLV